MHDQAKLIRALPWDCFGDIRGKDSFLLLTCYKDLNLRLSVAIFPAVWEKKPYEVMENKVTSRDQKHQEAEREKS